MTDTTINSMLASLAGRFGGRPALTLDARTVSFEALEAASTEVAHSLITAGVDPGDRIAILDKNSIEYYELMFGAAKAGAVMVGVNFRLSPREVATVIRDSRPRMLFLSPEFQDLADIVTADPSSQMIIVLLGDDYESWRSSGAIAARLPEASEDDVVLQMYSSGTTGTPKGAMLTHRNLMFTPMMGRDFYRMGSESVNLLTSPLFHIGGIGYSLTAFGQGGHTVLIRDFVVPEVLARIERHGVTNMFLVPTMIDMLVAESLKRPCDLSSLRLIAYGGAPITDRQLLNAVSVLDCSFMAVYGMTEAAGTVACLLPEDHDPNGPRRQLLGSIGTALPWIEIRIADPWTGNEAERGTAGELWVRSGQTMHGYWDQPLATREAIDADSWLHTGDIAVCDDKGYIFLKDRLKDMIVSGGENIYPIEVENVLFEHPGVQEVAVIGVPHDKWGETAKAVVVRAEGSSASAEEIIAFCRSGLASYKCPTSVEFLSALPRNASGKILKRVLRESYVTDTTAGAESPTENVAAR